MYRKEDYDKLNRAQKHELYEWQLANKKARVDKRSSNDKQKISAMQQQIDELKELVKSNENDKGGNDKHPALQRPPTQRKEGTLVWNEVASPSKTVTFEGDLQLPPKSILKIRKPSTLSPSMARMVICALSYDNDNDSPRTELDSHADSPVVGKHCKILEYTGK